MERNSDEALNERVAGFVSGYGSVPYDGVVVCRHPGHKYVLVLSYTESPEGVTPSESEAISKINHSRDVLDILKSKFPEFAPSVHRAAIRFEFCREYGTGAYAIARMDGDEFEWVGVRGAC
jgi:hypothetical protein